MSVEPEGGWIRIGEYVISIEKGTLWITNQDGEGGEFNPDTFEKAIKNYYEDNF